MILRNCQKPACYIFLIFFFFLARAVAIANFIGLIIAAHQGEEADKKEKCTGYLIHYREMQIDRDQANSKNDVQKQE